MPHTIMFRVCQTGKLRICLRVTKLPGAGVRLRKIFVTTGHCDCTGGET